MAVASLFHKRPYNGECCRGEQNRCSDLNDSGVKANVVRTKEIGNCRGMRVVHWVGSFGLSAKFAVAKRSRKQNVDNCNSKKEPTNFINIQVKAAEIEDNTFYDRELVWSGYKIGGHWVTHNLHKTRYKSASNSTELLCAMKLKGLGKLVNEVYILFKNRVIGAICHLGCCGFSEKSKLTRVLTWQKRR